MNCYSFRQTIQNCLDQREPLADQQSIQAHANACSECAAELKSYLLLEQVFQIPAAGSATKFIPRFSEIPARPTTSRFTWAASCCVAMLAIGIWAALPQLKHLSNSPGSIARGSLQSGQVAASHSSIGSRNSISSRHSSISPNSQPNNNSLAVLASGAQSFPSTRNNPLHESSEDSNELNSFWGGAGQLETTPRRTLASLRQCYEITAELPGIRPLESSLQWAIDALQRVFVPADSPQRTPEHPSSSWQSLQNNLEIA